MGDSARRTISAELARQLEEHGDLSPIINNKRKLSFAAITPPASDGSRSSSSSSSSASLITPASFHTYALSQNRKIVEIPEELESVETYVFLGFDESTAAQLWYRYARARDHPNDPPYGGGLEPDFFEFALRQIESGNIHDATCGDDDWDAFMRGKGINQRMREAILRPGFDGIRCTASCRFWLVGALTRAWAGLTALEQILQKKAVQTQNIRETTRRAAGSFGPSPGASSAAGSSGATTETSSAAPSGKSKGVSNASEPSPKKSRGPPENQQASEKAASKVPAMQTAAPAAPSTQPGAPSAMPGHRMLFRADDITVTGMLRDPNVLDVDFLSLMSYPGDFRGDKKILYLTPERETADRYAEFLLDHTLISNIVIIQVAVPEAWLSTLRLTSLWYGEGPKDGLPDDAWRKLIWSSRRGRLPQGEVKIMTKRDVLIGDIASGIHQKYSNMPDHTRIKPEHRLMVMIDGEMKTSVQWAFQTSKAMLGFVAHCSGTFWVHWLRTPPTMG